MKKIADEAEILFIGTKKRIEAQVVPKTGYKFRTIWISGFRRGLSLANLLFPLKLAVSLVQSFFIVKNFKPDVVIGTGGYVSGPVLRIASAFGIPTLIQEQNSCPGTTTRMLAEKVDEVHLTFESSKKYFKRTGNLFVTGNPTRASLEHADRKEALSYFGFNPQERLKTLLVFGGSLGAGSLNRAFLKDIKELIKHDLRIIWQTGETDYRKVLDGTAGIARDRLWVDKFIERMDYSYSASDLAVCRSGATTIAELTRLGKAAILVPYPRAAADHQTENARSLRDAGAAELIPDNELSSKLVPAVVSLLRGNLLEEMGEKSRKLGKPSAGRDIAIRALALAGNKTGRK